ncbi:MAG: DUF2892 domain-containing protein [Anaerolineae bacterium]|nr:DUF2892 domain-containing protein [Anaerolineae bacterium]
MDRNVGTVDRILRFVLGIVFVVLAFVLSGTSLGAVGLIVGLGLGILMLVTASINFCPLYSAIGFRTFRGENK